MKKPIMQTTYNNMGTILVIRSPFSRRWLFNVSYSHAMGEFIGRSVLYSVLCVVEIALTACVMGGK